MANQPVEKELLELERSYWQAIRDHDLEAALKLTDDPCIVAGAQGVASFDKNTFRKMMADERYSLDDFEIGSDVQVRMLGDDVAVLAYKVHENLTVEGKPVTMEAAEASTWIRRDGRWVCSFHCESILGDPFGRDRSSPKPAEAST